MPKLRKSNRLSPPFMYAFRSAVLERDSGSKAQTTVNADGERIIPSRKGTARGAMTEPVLRAEVARDLETLLNTIALDSTLSLRGHKNVRDSILNFGLPDLTHRSIDEIDVGDIKDEIATAIRNFEPRLIDETIEVTRDTSADVTALKVRFVVRADLACKPVNIPIEFTADLELESGKITVNRL